MDEIERLYNILIRRSPLSNNMHTGRLIYVVTHGTTIYIYILVHSTAYICDTVMP